MVNKIKDPPWFAGLSTRSVADSVAAKIQLFPYPFAFFNKIIPFSLRFCSYTSNQLSF